MRHSGRSTERPVCFAGARVNESAAHGKPIYTRELIGELYERHRKGEFAGREKEWARIENDIFAAQREGRVQAHPYLTNPQALNRDRQLGNRLVHWWRGDNHLVDAEELAGAIADYVQTTSPAYLLSLLSRGTHAAAQAGEIGQEWLTVSTGRRAGVLLTARFLGPCCS